MKVKLICRKVRYPLVGIAPLKESSGLYIITLPCITLVEDVSCQLRAGDIILFDEWFDPDDCIVKVALGKIFWYQNNEYVIYDYKFL